MRVCGVARAWCAQVSSPVLVDDYTWAARYAHVINAHQAAHYVAAVQQRGSAYIVKGHPGANGRGHLPGVVSQ